TVIALLSFVLQVSTGNKFGGALGVMVWFVLMRILPAVDLEHRLYRFGAVALGDYSDMNGYGHFVARTVWFDIYWLFAFGALLVGAHLLWSRGTEGGLRQRLAIARQRF